MEVCCCKIHLHGRWSINALIECAEKSDLQLSFNDYETFFKQLHSNCPSGEFTYVDWACADGQQLCIHAKHEWEALLHATTKCDAENRVKMVTFKKIKMINKKKQEVTRLKPVADKVNAKEITDFLETLLPNLIHHRNHLKHYRQTLPIFLRCYSQLQLDVDFSENLTVPMKNEPQSVYWCQEQISVHSGIVKENGEKSYHPYLSEDLVHDQRFSKTALLNMMDSAQKSEYVVVQSDNCVSQYKCGEHFADIQEMADRYETTIIRVYSIAGHGKGEVDHVGGLAKIAIRRAVASGKFFCDVSEMTEFLKSQFQHSSSPAYSVKEIEKSYLDKERHLARKRKINPIPGCSKFQVIVFRQGHKSVRASPHLCVCSLCLKEYGSCEQFQTYTLSTSKVNVPTPRSAFSTTNAGQSSKVSIAESDEEKPDYLLPDTICAIAAEGKSAETVYFIYITHECDSEQHAVTDDYNHTVPPKQVRPENFVYLMSSDFIY